MPDWGDEIPALERDALLDDIVESFTNERIATFKLQVASDPEDLFMRFTMNWAVRRDLVNTFFNEPVGLRGHYYFSPEKGEQFTRECIGKLKDKLETYWKQTRRPLAHILRLKEQKRTARLTPTNNQWRNWMTNGITHFPEVSGKQKWDNWFNASLDKAKIWPVESGYAIDPLFHMASGKKWIIKGKISPEENYRIFWNVVNARKEILKAAMIAAEKTPGFGEEAFQEFSDKGGSEVVLTGGSKIISEKLDIKGAFINPNDPTQSWQPPRKQFRALTIHHIGFS